MLLSEPMGLDACEDTLRQAVAGTRIVAETALSEKDLNLLTERIRLLFEANPRHAVSLLERDYPSAFLCFMAWKAKTSYSEGVFWPPILESLGLSGARWEKELGLAFQRCLAKTGLPQYEVPGALPYVTPVLLHGGIPDSCLDSFFRQVVDPLVRDGMVDFGAIEHEVKTLRKEDESYRKYEAQEKALRSELSIAEKVAVLCEKLESLKTRCHDRKVLLGNTHARLSGTAKSIWGVPWNPELSEQVKAAGRGRLDVLREAVAERDRVLGELQTSGWLDKDVQGAGESVWEQVGPYRLRPPYSPKALPVARAAMAISAFGAATGVVALRLWQTAGLRLPFISSRAGLLAAVGVLAAMAFASGAWASQIRGKTNRFEKSAQSLREALNAIQAVCTRPVLTLSAADADSLAEACRLIETADELEGGVLLTEREIDEVSNEISRIIDENPLFAGGDLQEGLGKLETAISARARVPKLLDELEKAEVRLAEQLHLPAFGPTVDEPIARYILLGKDSALEFLQECVSLRCFSRKDSPSESPVSVSPVSAAAVNHARRSYDLWAQMTDRKVEKEPRKDLTGQKEGRSAGLRIDTVDRVGRRREPRERTVLPQLPEKRAEDPGYERAEKTRLDLVTWAHRGQQHVGLLISGAEASSGCTSVCYSDTRD